MENFYFIGIDVSKKKLDYCLLFKGEVLKEDITTNHPAAIRGYLSSLYKEFGLSNEKVIICAEHTGQYTYPLVCACECEKCKLWLENPTQIKYCSGMQREKNDKIDAKRIAIYASRYMDNVKVYQRPTQELERLNQLNSELKMLVADKAKYQGQLTDQKDFMSAQLYKAKRKRLTTLIKGLKEAIDAIERDMTDIVANSKALSHQMKLLKNVEGVGPKVAMMMIIETGAFSNYENHRKFCCHAGVAPFRYTSGSSQRSRNKVSKKADKSIKTLLHLAAMSVIRKKESELKDYYIRKVEEGKNKMTVINAMRAKLVARMFAVIKNDQDYTINHPISLA